MIALKLLLVGALAFTANAKEDLKLAYKLSKCLKKTMDGLPSAQIPSHNPLKIQDVSWHAEYEGFRGTLNLSNIEWHGIPDWFASIVQESKDSDSVAVLPFEIKFPQFKIQLEYSLDAVNAWTPEVAVDGDVQIFLSGITMEGEVRYNKPGFNLTEGIENLDLKSTIQQTQVFISGVGSGYSDLASQFLNGIFGTLQLGPALKERLNTAWFGHHERIDALLEFCKEN